MALSDVAEALKLHQRYLVTTHQNPDGDAVGSLLAMAHLLRTELGKSVVAVLPDPLTKRYRFLPGLDSLVTPAEASTQGPYDALVTVDVSTPGRIGAVKDLVTDSMVTINVDHHVTNPRTDDVVWVETLAAATCEMLIDLYREFDATPTPEIATALYTGIITDTGQFAFRGTTAKAMRAAADLIDQGADYELVAQEVYHKTDEPVVRALGGVLTRMELHDNGRLAISWMNADETEIDHEGFVNHLQDIETVEVAVLMRPLSSGEWKVSLRSGGTVDVAKLAARIDGGGHSLAAGGTLPSSSPEKARDDVLRICLEALAGVERPDDARA